MSAEEKAHAFSATKELSSIANHHQRCRLGQMVPVVQMKKAAERVGRPHGSALTPSVLVQALTTLIEQLCALPNELCQEIINRYRRLCDCCGCHNEC